jgi:hypothetical protein
MQVVFHIGAHDTETDSLWQALSVNTRNFARQGVAVPDPDRYRPIFRQLIERINSGEQMDDTQDLILDASFDADDVQRVIYMNENFMGIGSWAITERGLYPRAGEKAHFIQQLFPDHQVEYFLTLRNPATFLPANIKRLEGGGAAALLEKVDPMQLRWSQVVRDIRLQAPDAKLTVWCDEDAPMIWPDIIWAIAGLPEGAALRGPFALLMNLLQDEGRERLKTYLASTPPQNKLQRVRVAEAFLEKFCREDALDMEVLQGWDNAYIEALSDQYDDDVLEIMEMGDVEVITP